VPPCPIAITHVYRGYSYVFDTVIAAGDVNKSQSQLLVPHCAIVKYAFIVSIIDQKGQVWISMSLYVIIYNIVLYVVTRDDLCSSCFM